VGIGFMIGQKPKAGADTLNIPPVWFLTLGIRFLKQIAKENIGIGIGTQFWQLKALKLNILEED
jgi:hypothetical protein